VLPLSYTTKLGGSAFLANHTTVFEFAVIFSRWRERASGKQYSFLYQVARDF
jgi:hypothetical protein